MLDWIIQNSGAVTLVFTGVVTLSTVCYAYLTWALVAETKRMRQVQTEPKVVTGFGVEREIRSFSPHVETSAFFYIRNIGLGPAFNISVEKRQETERFEKLPLPEKLSESPLFNKGVDYLGPGQHLRHSFYYSLGESKERIDVVVAVRIKYKSATNKEYADDYTLEMGDLKDYLMLGESPLESIAEDMGKIQKNTKSLKENLFKLKSSLSDIAIKISSMQYNKRDR